MSLGHHMRNYRGEVSSNVAARKVRNATPAYLSAVYAIRTFNNETIRSPEGIRTLVADLRSQSPRPLDDGALVGKAIQFFRWGTRTRT